MAYYTDKSRTTFNDISGLPVKTVRVNEGIVSRFEAVEPTGGISEVIVYSNQISKGDLVTIDTKYSKTNNVVVTVRTAEHTSYANGIAVSSPWGADGNTETGQQPLVEDMRVIDVAFFGHGIIEFVANNNIPAGADVEFSLDKGFDNYIEAFGSTAGHDGAMIALVSVNEGDYCPVLMGAYGYNENVSSPTLQSKSENKSKKSKEE